MTITRRDFLNGAALTIAAGLTPAAQLAAQARTYPPALTGLRGQHDGSYDVIHALAREGRRFPVETLPIEERYDLVVVGSGISGLSAAWYYRRAKPSARILILEVLDDFGGHAKRNEFTLGARRIVGYGGSQSLQSPNALYSPVAKQMLRDLGVDVRRFETAFDSGFYASLGLKRGVFFPREAFGRDVLVADDKAVAQFPISDASKVQLSSLDDPTRDPLAGKSIEEKQAILRRTSYRDYLMKICGCSDEVANCFQGRSLGFFGLGADAIAATDARDLGYPGFAGLNLPQDTNPAWHEPYIYHFPDGNASIARLLARGLIPRLAPGATMEDVVEAPFDYARLDDVANDVRIRLNSTCVDVRNSGDAVQLGYVRDGAPHRVEASHAVLACFHMAIPFIMPELPATQRDALMKNVKTPICYTNVLVRNWQAFVDLKVNSISAPMSFHHQVSLDFPVSLGGISHPRDPAEPMLLHLAHVPYAPNQGLDARTQFHIGQGKLYAMTFADFEARIRDDLDRMLGAGGFSSARDIAAITVNRWPHGYGYVANSLFDDVDAYEDKVLRVARAKAGRVAIANSDSGGDAWVHYAIDQAARAVGELVG